MLFSRSKVNGTQRPSSFSDLLLCPTESSIGNFNFKVFFMMFSSFRFTGCLSPSADQSQFRQQIQKMHWASMESSVFSPVQGAKIHQHSNSIIKSKPAWFSCPQPVRLIHQSGSVPDSEARINRRICKACNLADEPHSFQ